ncbi:MAG: hypothetical protein MJ058_04315 [Akkermansia sp.]|nr:hypothetical protein [Akkermansia sp.]
MRDITSHITPAPRLSIPAASLIDGVQLLQRAADGARRIHGAAPVTVTLSGHAGRLSVHMDSLGRRLGGSLEISPAPDLPRGALSPVTVSLSDLWGAVRHLPRRGAAGLSVVDRCGLAVTAPGESCPQVVRSCDAVAALTLSAPVGWCDVPRCVLEAVAPAAAGAGSPRPDLGGVWCDIHDGGPLSVAATDGHRLHVVEVPGLVSSSKLEPVQVPAHVVAAVLAAPLGVDGVHVCRCDDDGGTVTVTLRGAVTASMRWDRAGRSMPDWRAVVPGKEWRDVHRVASGIDGAAVADAIRRLIGRRSRPAGGLDGVALVDGRGLTIAAGSGAAGVAAAAHRDGLILSLDPHYLGGAMAHLEGVELAGTHAPGAAPRDVMPVVVRGSICGGDGLRMVAVIMPRATSAALVELARAGAVPMDEAPAETAAPAPAPAPESAPADEAVPAPETEATAPAPVAETVAPAAETEGEAVATDEAVPAPSPAAEAEAPAEAANGDDERPRHHPAGRCRGVSRAAALEIKRAIMAARSRSAALALLDGAAGILSPGSIAFQRAGILARWPEA